MELNCEWTQDNTETFFDDFYKEVVQSIKMYCFYINKKKELFHVKKDILWLHDGILKKEELIYLLKHNTIYDKTKYQILSIMKYNIDIEPSDINFFLDDPNKKNFLSIKKNIDSIKWNNTITLFLDLNSIIIVYNEKKNMSNTTKKIYIGKKKQKMTRKSI